MYWTTHKIYNRRIEFRKSVAFDDLIYSFVYDHITKKPYIYILNTHILSWSVLSNRNNGEPLMLPDDVPLNDHTIVPYEKKIYLWGGYKGNEEEISDILYCFDTETLNWSRPEVTGIIPGKRFDHSACISSHLMYIFDGYGFNDHQYGLRDVYCLDLKTMNWSHIKTFGEIPLDRNSYGTAIVNNRIYTFGGFEFDVDEDEEIYFNDTMYLNLTLNQWYRQESTGYEPAGPMDRSLFVHNNKIYVFGSDYFIYDFDNHLYCFDTKRNHWNKINPSGRSVIRRNEQACIMSGDKMVSFSTHRYETEINVLDFNPSLKTLAIVAIIENGLDFSDLPEELRYEIDSMRSSQR